LPLALGAVLVLALIAIAVVLLVRFDVFGGSSSSSSVQGSGVAATQTRELQRFSSVELAGSNDVVVHVGGKQSLVVHADDNLLRHVTTQVHAGNPMIGNTSSSITTKTPMSVEVSVPSLEALTLTGSGVISTTGIKTSSLTVRLSGSGVLRASGSATRLDVSLSGSGDAQLEQLAARDVHARREWLRPDPRPRDQQPRRRGTGKRRDHLQRESGARHDEHHGQRGGHRRMTRAGWHRLLFALLLNACIMGDSSDATAGSTMQALSYTS
jgi:phage gp45-like